MSCSSEGNPHPDGIRFVGTEGWIHVSHRATTLCNLTDISARVGRKVTWDAGEERFVADDRANRLLGRAMRSPWRI